MSNGRIVKFNKDGKFIKAWGKLGSAVPAGGRGRIRGLPSTKRAKTPVIVPIVRWLVANRPIKAIGIDTASIDYGPSTMFETHRALYEHDIPAFENLMNLDRLPARGATIVALPMKIKGGSGAPLRAVAFLSH